VDSAIDDHQLSRGFTTGGEDADTTSTGLFEPSITLYQWKFQDPKMEVLYHIRPYFMGIFPYIGLI